MMPRVVKVNLSRTHFKARAPCSRYLKALHVPAAPLYLRYSFVLDWSLVKALTGGAPIAAADKAPTQRVFRAQRSWRHLPFFVAAVAAWTVQESLNELAKILAMRERARFEVTCHERRGSLSIYDIFIGYPAMSVARTIAMTTKTEAIAC